MIIDNVKWEIRYPFIVAECPNCRTSFTIEWVTLTSAIKHCGLRTRLPEKVYEDWCAVRDAWKTAKPAPSYAVRSI